MPFEDNSLSGYLSFGVIEHFQEGPKEVLDEVYRVLKPGGIAIITTPNKSWNVRKNNVKRSVKNIVKKLIGRKIIHSPFFQYEYTPNQLRKFMLKSGLFPLLVSGSDYLYSFTEYGGFKGNNIYNGSFAHKISPVLDNSFLRNLGSQSLTITTKVSEKMQCFFCGNDKAHKDSLKKFTVPVCDDCSTSKNSHYYLKGTKTYFHDKYIINPEILKPTPLICDFCGKESQSDILFERFGFNKNVCPQCLKDPEINIELSNNNIQAVWRKRK